MLLLPPLIRFLVSGIWKYHSKSIFVSIVNVLVVVVVTFCHKITFTESGVVYAESSGHRLGFSPLDGPAMSFAELLVHFCFRLIGNFFNTIIDH